MTKPVYLISSIDYLRNDRPLVMAHRGRSAFTPESSYQSFKEAYDLKVDVLEIDVRLTQDNIPIVFHDEYLDRTTNGKGLVINHSVDQIQNFNLGYWFKDKETGEYPFRRTVCKPLKLSEFFRNFPDIKINIDIKNEEENAPHIINDSILEAGAENRVLVGSFHHKQLSRFRKISQVKTSASPREVVAFLYHKLFLTNKKFCALQVPMKMYGIKIVTRNKVNRAHRKNLAVHVWTVNNEETMKKLLDWGIDGIFTDNPELLLDVMSPSYKKIK